MSWWFYMPSVMWCVWIFVLGLGVGSFLNVVIARLPYQKSLLWPGSRCFSCLQPIRLTDNLPIIGYLRLRGRCRNCQTPFSSRYLWVEVGTACAFLGLFAIEVLARAEDAPASLAFWQRDGLRFDFTLGVGPAFGPPAEAWVYFTFHAILLSLLIAAALIDAEHKIIPLQITYIGTLIGLIGGTLLPWPWPVPVEDIPPRLMGLGNEAWLTPELAWRGSVAPIPTGAQLWPFIGPLPSWAPPGSWQLGLLNALIGAAAGMFVGRAVKFLFEMGLGKEALGLGDADLLMMAGAFLGWQVAVLALPAGALISLPIVLPLKAWEWWRGKAEGSELPFGPGIAAGVVVVWLGWPAFGELMRVFAFDPMLIGIVSLFVAGGFVIAGLLFRRRVAEA